MGKAARALAFAQHIPTEQLIRRAELEIRRRVRDRFPLRDAECPQPMDQLPQPLFASRVDLAPEKIDGGWRFSFLNRCIEIRDDGAGLDWCAPGEELRDQAWRKSLNAMEYLEGVDTASFESLVGEWIRRNGAASPGAWRGGWSNYALSLRVVVWMQELARRGRSVRAELRSDMYASLARQLRYLEADVESDVGGNHLIKNAKALVWAGAFFSGPTAQRWRDLGRSTIRRELPRQILPDGMHYERSADYHGQVFADLLECRVVMQADELPELDATLSHMAQVCADLVHPDGAVAQFNDAGLNARRTPEDCLSAYEKLMGGAPAPRSVFAFLEAGYYGLRNAAHYFVADCGRIGPDDLPHHGHGDVFSFEWSVAGQRMIVDQGVFELIAGSKRDQSRSAMSHNTLCFEGHDQAEFFGAHRCGRRPNVDVRRWEKRSDGFVLEGSHDGFRRAPGRPVHVRRFEVRQNSVSIFDRIEGLAKFPARISFLLHPDTEVLGYGKRIELVNGAARAAMEADRPLGVHPAVWWPDMGVERQTQRLTLTLAPGERTSQVRLGALA